MNRESSNFLRIPSREIQFCIFFQETKRSSFKDNLLLQCTNVFADTKSSNFFGKKQETGFPSKVTYILKN